MNLRNCFPLALRIIAMRKCTYIAYEYFDGVYGQFEQINSDSESDHKKCETIIYKVGRNCLFDLHYDYHIDSNKM